MIVYKFGGASVRDAEGIRNLCRIVSREKQHLVVVVSAFGKTTNALEKVLNTWLSGDPEWRKYLEDILASHRSVAAELFTPGNKTAVKLEISFSRLKDYLSKAKQGKYDFEYDQVVSYGEVWSTLIVEGFLSSSGLDTCWLDIRENLLTDDRYRDADILWEESTGRIKRSVDFTAHRIYVTQGFIGGTAAGETTTLGREGSDYTAAIIGNILDAVTVVFWKDVPGILSADPMWMTDVERLDAISYKDAVEMTFSGAKVIHPKTIKPLHNKNIPLYVKSFLHPDEPGTLIAADAKPGKLIPVYIRKENQILISILPNDFSFVMGDCLGRVFHSFMLNGIKVNLVQASAVSINVCVDDERTRVNALIDDLRKDYKAIYNDEVEMLSIRHSTSEAIENITKNRDILLEQRTRRIARFVVKKIIKEI